MIIFKGITMLKFSELTLSDREKFTALTDNIPLSYYHFTHMYSWRNITALKWCEIEQCLCVFIEYIKGYPLMYFPLGENADICKIASIVRDSLPNVKKMAPVGKSMLESLLGQCPKVKPIEKRSLFDYVYSYEDLSTLKGSKYHSKRNHVNQFKSKYVYEYTEITKDNLDILNDAAYALHTPDGGELDQEFLTIKELIKNFTEFSLYAAVITVEDKYVSYSIGEKIMGGKTALIHIEKADRRYAGAYAAVNYLFLNNSFAGCELVNREEDMGNSGLRKAKSSYYPVFFNNVYEVDIHDLR